MARHRARRGRGDGVAIRPPDVPAAAPVNGALYAALDLGTNSCRMLIATPQGGHFHIVDAFSKSVRLGIDLERTGALSSQGINRTLQALRVCAAKLGKLEIKRTRMVATEACRRASNGVEFLKRVASETGLALEIITPEEEARLAMISCAPLVDPETTELLVIDIGGGSTELIWIDVADVAPENRVAAMMKLRPGTREKDGPGARVIDWISVPLGVATLHERFIDVDDEPARFALMSWYFEEQMVNFKPYLAENVGAIVEGFQMIGTSGTITTVGAAHLGLRRYERRRVDGMRLTGTEIDTVIHKYLSLGIAGRMADPGLGRDRAALIMSGSAILQTLLRLWPTERIRVADRGLREGMLYAMMSADGALTGGPA